jgi:uncharacterized membrane protein
MKKQDTSTYENNPFLVGLHGLQLFFRKAQPIAIIAIVVAVLNAGSQGTQNVLDVAEKTNRQQTADMYGEWQSWVGSLSTSDIIVFAILIASLLFIFFIIMFIINAMFDYTSAQLARNKEVAIGEAFKAALTHVGSYAWLQVLIGVKVILWSLLLIIPGIIMAVRYSLAGVSFFETDKRGNQAIKHSLHLTKGAWLTTFASGALWNLITLGLIEPVLRPGTNATLYQQFKRFETTNEPKPEAHVLSWLTLVVPFVLFSLLLLGIILFAVALDINGFS